VENNERVEKLVESCIKWINENEFENYHGSLRTLVSWFAKTDRVFQWTSMSEVDEATKVLMDLLDRGPVKIQKKNVHYKQYIPTSQCVCCGTSLVGFVYSHKQGNLCKQCYDYSYSYALEGIEEMEIVEKID